MAQLRCDICGCVEVVRCGFKTPQSGRPISETVFQSRHLHRALEKLRWSYIKHHHCCQECTANRRTSGDQTPKGDTELENPKLAEVFPTDMRKPSPTQKREIIKILEDVYDDKHKRYTGGETDKTVAETVGANVMPGWVAAIREELFGPAGVNEDMINLRDDIQVFLTECRHASKELEDRLAQMNVARDRAADLQRRLDTIIRAVGPKADKVR